MRLKPDIRAATGNQKKELKVAKSVAELKRWVCILSGIGRTSSPVLNTGSHLIQWYNRRYSLKNLILVKKEKIEKNWNFYCIWKLSSPLVTDNFYRLQMRPFSFKASQDQQQWFREVICKENYRIIKITSFILAKILDTLILTSLNWCMEKPMYWCNTSHIASLCENILSLKI